jgi:hypothetical protein
METPGKLRRVPINEGEGGGEVGNEGTAEETTERMEASSRDQPQQAAMREAAAERKLADSANAGGAASRGDTA